jgi:Anti-sigma-K factor rskA
MNGELTHDQLRELLGAYAVNALEPHELVLVEHHLEICTSCPAELEILLDTAASLAIMAQDDEARFAPDPKMNDRIRQAIAPVAKSSGAAETASAVTAVSAVSAVTGEASTVVSKLDLAPVVSIDSARSVSSARLRPRWKIVAASAAAATVIAFPIGMAVSGGTGTSIAALANTAAKATGSRTIVLNDTEKRPVADIVLTSTGQAYLRNTALPKLSDDKTYQLWAIENGKPISIGVLGSDPKTIAVVSSRTPQAIAISVETTGGAVAPSTPIASGAVS